MSENILYDHAKESLMKLWVEIQQNPTMAGGSLSKEVWKKLVEKDQEDSKAKLTDLRQELQKLG